VSATAKCAMMTHDNPYRASMELDDLAMPQVGKTIGLWVIVCGANAPGPMLIARGLFDHNFSVAGMAAGLTVCCGTGILLCFMDHTKLVQIVTRGGWLVAALQMIPILHVICGWLAMAIITSLIGALGLTQLDFFEPPASARYPLSDLFLASILTILTGVQLMTAAFGLDTSITRPEERVTISILSRNRSATQ